MPPNVFDHEPLYNSIVLNRKTSPGVVTLSGHNRKIVWDVKNGPFQNGAIGTMTRIPPIEFSASFYLVKDPGRGVDDFADWDVFVPVIKSTVQGRTPKAATVYHPDLAAVGITAVILSELGGFQYDGKGGATVVVKFLEYRPPQTAGGTPKGTQETKDPAIVSREAAITGLNQQWQNTPWG